MFTALGASIVTLAAMVSSVEAKTVFYEINGERYSYDTSNRQQAAAARQQIEAAKIVEAARAKAAAERASNPLVAIFGSQAQQEAVEAQAQLERILADQQRAAAARKVQRPQPTAKDDSVAKSAEQKPGEAAGVIQREPTTVAAIAAAQSPGLQLAPDLRGAGKPAQSNGALRTAIKSISLDAETGIKTIFRVDGSIHEELFDPSLLSKLDSEQRAATAVSTGTGVAQPHKGSPDDTTGSTGLPRTLLGLNAGANTPGRFPAN
jgi:NADH dehydrogenase/NADH:ubiquinone oxidoreductase subunit G